MRLPFMRWIHPSALQPCSGEDDLFPFGNDPERSMKIGRGAWDVGQCGVFDHLISSFISNFFSLFFKTRITSNK